MIKILNSEPIKIYLFKFLHDLHSTFGSHQRISTPEIVGQKYLGNGYLSAEFFEQIGILRSSCNDFEGLQKKLSILMSDSSSEKDLLSLVNMFEYIVPSYSLDLLTLIMIAAGNLEEGNCAMT